MSRLELELVGVCGVYCGFCPVFNVKCPGCLKDPRSKKCALYTCASNKAVGCCFQCSEFPCQTHYKKGIYDKRALDNWKKMTRKQPKSSSHIFGANRGYLKVPTHKQKTA